VAGLDARRVQLKGVMKPNAIAVLRHELMTEKITDRVRKKLGKQIGDEKVVSSGDAYERSRKTWNARVTHRPDLIVLCENTADVQAAIKAAWTLLSL
jgi:hypothetical protein